MACLAVSVLSHFDINIYIYIYIYMSRVEILYRRVLSAWLLCVVEVSSSAARLQTSHKYLDGETIRFTAVAASCPGYETSTILIDCKIGAPTTFFENQRKLQ